MRENNNTVDGEEGRCYYINFASPNWAVPTHRKGAELLFFLKSASYMDSMATIRSEAANNWSG